MKTCRTPFCSLAPEVASSFEDMGRRWGSDINKHRDAVIEQFSPLVSAAPNENIKVERDIAYGAAPRQILDVYSQDGWEPGTKDVIMFFHGGAFLRGKKSFNGHIYDNVAYWFARQGVVAVNVEYRLAPETPYPGGAEDVIAAFRWAQENIDTRGGNRARIFLMGHSAGGSHVAGALFDPSIDTIEDDEVAGAILVSARLRADVHADNPNAGGVRAYYGADPSLYELRSPVTHAHLSNVPLLVAVAQYENPFLDEYGAQFYEAARLPPRTALTRFKKMERHNHTSIVAHFNSGEETLGLDILAFMADV